MNSSNNNQVTHERRMEKARNPFQWEIPFLYTMKLALAVTQLAFVAMRYMQRNNENLTSSETKRLGFMFFASVWTILGSIIFITLSLLRKHIKTWHRSVFSMLTGSFWIIGGAIIHTLSVALTCGQNAPRNGGNGGALNCHQLLIIEWLSWGLVILTVLSAIITLILGRKRKHQYPRDDSEKMLNHNTASNGHYQQNAI